MIDIRTATRSDIPVLYALYDSIGKKDDGYFERCLEEHCDILIAALNQTPCGFCLLNWAPRYTLYRTLEIPEIQDLNVMPAYRRQGVATALIKWCEGLANAKNKTMIGIGVGLTRPYGPAQILYAQLGFKPDGYGVTYDREAVEPFRLYRMDDDLSLMLIKDLA